MTGISKDAGICVNDYANHVFNVVMAHACDLCELNKKTTLTSREVQTGVRLAIPGELAKHAVCEGTKAVSKFSSNLRGGETRKAMSQSARAGLQFPVGRVKNLMKQVWKGRIAQGAPVYMAAVMEYHVAELLELAGNAAKDYHCKRITPRHCTLAIRGDEELDKLVGNTCIKQGGVIPHIHRALIPKNKPHKAGGFGF